LTEGAATARSTGDDPRRVVPKLLQRFEGNVGVVGPYREVVAESLKLSVRLGEVRAEVADRRVLAPRGVVEMVMLEILVKDRLDFRPEL
jgi:hypothetical protein